MTQESFDSAMSAIKQDLDQIRAAMATKEDVAPFATKVELGTFTDTILREFHVVAENIHSDIAGANADQFSLLDGRVKTIEQHLRL